MTEARNGDTVRVHYTGTLKDGKVFDTSTNREPLEFTLGEGRIIPGFEQAVIGMSPGETKTAEVPSGEAYGPRHDELTVVMDRTELPSDLEPRIGMQLQGNRHDGTSIVVTVTGISESDVTLDANHPLAGEDLTFDIQLVEIL